MKFLIYLIFALFILIQAAFAQEIFRNTLVLKNNQKSPSAKIEDVATGGDRKVGITFILKHDQGDDDRYTCEYVDEIIR